jgi:hypothetical protein
MVGGEEGAAAQPLVGNVHHWRRPLMRGRTVLLAVGVLAAAVLFAGSARRLVHGIGKGELVVVSGAPCGFASSPCEDAAAIPTVQRLEATMRTLKRRLRKLRGSAEGFGKAASAFVANERSSLKYVEEVRHRIGIAEGREEDFLKTPGPVGPAGARGRPGAPGPDGRAGYIGRMGYPGVDGLEGPVGWEGREGRMGGSGQQGAPGQQGPPGQDGLPGAMGPAGRRGRRGRSFSHTLCGRTHARTHWLCFIP